MLSNVYKIQTKGSRFDEEKSRPSADLAIALLKPIERQFLQNPAL
jgi:hypothetical protein